MREGVSAGRSGSPPLARDALCRLIRVSLRVAIPARPVLSPRLPSLEKSAALGWPIRRSWRSACGAASPVCPQVDGPPESGESARRREPPGRWSEAVTDRENRAPGGQREDATRPAVFPPRGADGRDIVTRALTYRPPQ